MRSEPEMMDDAVWEGVNALLDDYAMIGDGDVVIVAYTPDSRQSAAWVAVALEMRGIAVTVLPMAPLRDETFAARLVAALPSPSRLAGRLIVMTFELDTLSHVDVFREALAAHAPSRYLVIRARSASPELFSKALRVGPRELSALNTAILERCMPAEALRVTSPRGTDLRIRLDRERHEWISVRGRSRPGSFTILPAGEVATSPAVIDGVLVADFALHVNLVTSFDVRLADHPITVVIRDGQAIDYRCDGAEVSRFLDQCFSTKGGLEVRELGFGTNAAVEPATRWNSHINERRAGHHLGFGRNREMASEVAPIHLDLIASGGLLWIDDDATALDLGHLIPSRGEHPLDVEDSDVGSPEG
jgi:leucyl aminopeptidase (aminopeptidase T)